MKRVLGISFVGFALILLTVACGGGSSAPTSTPTPRAAVTPTPGAAATPTAPTGAVLDISSKGETLEFDKKSLAAKTGSEVVVRLKNNSKALEHNFVVVKAGTKDAVSGDGAAAGPDNEWIRPKDERVLAHTKLLKPGQTGEVRFSAPAAGKYQFVCTFPGHAVTMFGTFDVTQ